MLKPRAFTLSELLVSLAVLGLIAAISIPTVYNSVKTQREKAVWKETLQILNTLYYEGSMEGNVAGALSTYVLEHVNAVKVCNSNVSTQGCYAFYETSEAGFELANGAVVNGIDPNGRSDAAMIDINGSEGPNAENEDRLELIICLDDGCWGHLDRNIVGRIEPYGSSEQIFYNELFGGS